MTGLSSQLEMQILADANELAAQAARVFIEHAANAIQKCGRFTVALSGGSTPKRLYQLLTSLAIQLDWTKVDFFWSDERHVPPQHADSNYRMVYEALLSRISVPEKNIHRVLGELPDAQDAALDYEQTLKHVFELKERELPRFDLILLGLGPDAHTASIFPDTSGLLETDRLVQAPWIEKLNSHRVTMTMPVMNRAAGILFLVSGSEKAEALRQVLQGERDYQRFPAQAVKPTDGTLHWLVDKAAASKL